MTAKVIVQWQKPVWIDFKGMHKLLKKFYHTCASFDASLVVIDGDGSIGQSGYRFSFKVVSSLEEVLNNEELYVLLEPRNKIPKDSVFEFLNEYEHKDNVTYVIWSDYGTVPFDSFVNKEHVSIDTEDDTCPLWADVALGIVLYDRWNK